MTFDFENYLVPHTRTILFFICVGVALLVFLYIFPVPPPHANLLERLSGTIVLDVENYGEAWYIIPETHERTPLGTPEQAFLLLVAHGYTIQSPYDALQIMKKSGIPISTDDLARIPISPSRL